MEYSFTEIAPRLYRGTLSGRGDAAAIDGVEAAFTASITNGARNTILDLSGVPFMGSLGIRMLLSCSRVMARRDAKLVLFGVQPMVMDVFKVMALPDLIPIVDTEEAALALINA